MNKKCLVQCQLPSDGEVRTTFWGPKMSGVLLKIFIGEGAELAENVEAYFVGLP